MSTDKKFKVGQTLWFEGTNGRGQGEATITGVGRVWLRLDLPGWSHRQTHKANIEHLGEVGVASALDGEYRVGTVFLDKQARLDELEAGRLAADIRNAVATIGNRLPPLSALREAAKVLGVGHE